MLSAGAVLDGFLRAPVADLDEVLPGRFLVLAPHPDDESLGCGGIIAEACARGRPPIVAIMTDGAASHPNSRDYPPARLAELRAREVRNALACLGLPAERLVLLNAPDGDVPHAGVAAVALAARLAVLADGCDAILTSWRHDPHGDHVSAWTIARDAAAFTGAALWEYPVWGWTLPFGMELPAQAWSCRRLDIAKHLAAKRRAIAAHASQLGGVVTDDPEGFVLARDFLALFDRPFEYLVRQA
jgi:LmbE family N-acetylglucosaminyl deacetylase